MSTAPTQPAKSGTATTLDGRLRGDEELLEQFLLDSGPGGADAAFRELVRRHGPMVLNVCRQTLGDAHDAEDAFQATFLNLARCAGAIRDGRRVSRWLYEVAYRTSLRARARSARRRAGDRDAAVLAAAARPDPGQAWDDVGPVLHEEVNRLPANYRSAVVLCYFEGRTDVEAAELLSWPVGTVKGRLSRARDLLRSRLTRRGVALPLLLVMTRLTDRSAAAAELPDRLVDAAVAVGRGADLAPEVASLANEVSLPSSSAASLSVGPVAVGIAAAVIGLFGWGASIYADRARVGLGAGGTANAPAAPAAPVAKQVDGGATGPATSPLRVPGPVRCDDGR